jgi:4-amino-4-deoxy-L-arabinose transferase-like glycosyltransferase
MLLKFFRNITLPAYAVLFVGFILRLIAWTNTSVINPDGAVFIHQARAIYFGQTDTLFCAQSDLANYPVMIVGAYWFFHDWVFSARFISFIFGFGTLIPLYFLFKRFFDDRISVLGTLVFAVIPVFVGSSVDLIRDPILWFFAALGFYWFILALDNKSPWILTWSCLSLMMASWARIEASFIILFSLLFLTVQRHDHKLKNLFCFLLPVVGLALLVLLIVLIGRDHADSKALELGNPIAKLSSPLAAYRAVSERLAAAALQNRGDSFGLFLSEARRNMWLVAVGALLNRCMEAFFAPFLLLCGLGLGAARKKLRSDERLRYFIYISLILLVVLYTHVMRSWYVEYRHICLIIISCSVFIGIGIDTLVQFFLNRSHPKRDLVVAILALFIVTLPLPKNLKPRDADKLVFKEIGEFLADREGTHDLIPMATSCSSYRVISFYAHLNYPGAPCPDNKEIACWEYFTDNFDHFMRHVAENHTKYLLWSEKLWPAASGDVFGAPYADHLKELKRWHHPDTGEMILYEIR